MNESLDNPQTQPGDDPQAHESDEGEAALVIGFALICVILTMLVFWPSVKQHIPGLADPPEVQVLGPVQRVSYVGGFGTDTQVEVGATVVLLHGAVELERGVVVERHVSAVDAQLCVVGTDRCHAIRSR